LLQTLKAFPIIDTAHEQLAGGVDDLSGMNFLQHQL
jgi:hypothetical protein